MPSCWNFHAQHSLKAMRRESIAKAKDCNCIYWLLGTAGTHHACSLTKSTLHERPCQHHRGTASKRPLCRVRRGLAVLLVLSCAGLAIQPTSRCRWLTARSGGLPHEIRNVVVLHTVRGYHYCSVTCPRGHLGDQKACKTKWVENTLCNCIGVLRMPGIKLTFWHGTEGQLLCTVAPSVRRSLAGFGFTDAQLLDELSAQIIV